MVWFKEIFAKYFLIFWKNCIGFVTLLFWQQLNLFLVFPKVWWRSLAGSKIFHSVLLVYFVVINHIRGETDNVDIKDLIKEAGCPFHNKEQLLLNHVCLMPDYQKNEHPENSNAIARVDTDWFKAPQVLDVDERKNRITFQLYIFNRKYPRSPNVRYIQKSAVIATLIRSSSRNPLKYMKMVLDA